MIVDALVFRAGLSPLNKIAVGYRDWVGVVTDVGDGPVAIWSLVKLDRERWLVPGTRCRIDLDPRHVGSYSCFSVDPTSVPTVVERVAAADPTFTDPIGARRFAKAALTGAREIKPMFNTLMGPGEAPHVPQSGAALDDSWFARCEQAIGAVGQLPAPAGSVRAVAIVTAMRLLLRDTGRDLATGAPRREDRTHFVAPYRKARSGNEAVFAVHAPGRQPWATFVDGFKAPDDKPVDRALRAYPYLPVLTPAAGGGPITVIWDQVPAQTQVPMDARTMAEVNPLALIAQVRAARRAAAFPPPQFRDDMPPVAHQAAARFVAYLRSLPPHAHPAAIQQAVAGLAPYPPHERERYLALWRRYGIPV